MTQYLESLYTLCYFYFSPCNHFNKKYQKQKERKKEKLFGGSGGRVNEFQGGWNEDLSPHYLKQTGLVQHHRLL
jgi:hypothetical protein